MGWFLSPFSDPADNLALEEVLLKEDDGAHLFFWVSPPSAVVGRHQVIWKEVQPAAVLNGLRVYRRLSGGGTVYHDSGNLNFSFVEGKAGQVDFRRFLKRVVRGLQSVGVPAVFHDKSDLHLDGLKISGNAQTLWRGRILHHGTLLVSSDLQRLADALTPLDHRIESRAIQSRRAPVTNLTRHLGKDLLPLELARRLGPLLVGEGEDSAEAPPPGAGVCSRVAALAAEKFAHREWIEGNSPPYRLERSWANEDSTVTVSLEVTGGRLTTIAFPGEGPVPDWARERGGRIQGCWHHPVDLAPIISGEDPAFLTTIF